MKKLCSIKPAGKTARGGSKASGTLGERPLLPLATFHLAFDQVQPLLLDVLPGENQAMVFVSKIKGICGREQEQMGLVGLGGHLHHICVSRKSLQVLEGQWHLQHRHCQLDFPSSASPGNATPTPVVHLCHWWGFL